MAEWKLSTAEVEADPDVPDPALINTLDELAESLRLLRIEAGNPSFRAIAGLIVNQGMKAVPYNTIHDAMDGRHMPKRDLVLSIVRALDGGDLGPWRSAWNRVERGRQNLAGPNGAAAPQPRTSSSPPVQSVGGISQIAAVNKRDGATLIQSEPIEQVVNQLSAMTPSDAAARLNLVPAPRVAEVLTRMDERKAGNTLQHMASAVGAQALSMAELSVAGELLALIHDPARASILSQLAPARAAGMILQINNWPSFLSQVQNLAPDAVTAILMAMSDDDIKRFFENPSNASRGQQFLDGATSKSAARILRAVAPEQAGLWLKNSEMDKIAGIIGDLSDDEFARILKEMSANRATALHKALGAEHLLRVVKLLPTATAIRPWWEQLQGHRLLSLEESEQLRAAMRRASR